MFFHLVVQKNQKIESYIMIYEVLLLINTNNIIHYT